MPIYDFKRDHFTTNEVSLAVAQASIATFHLGGYLFDGFPSIVVKRKPSNVIAEIVNEEKDTFDVIMIAGDASVTLSLSFADAAAHALQFRNRDEPDQRLIKLAETAVVKLGSILSGDPP